MNPEFPNEVVHDVQPALLQTLFSNLLAQVIVVSSAKPPRNIRDALRDLLPFVRFKICEKHPWSATFSKVEPATLLQVTLLHGCFSRFLNYTNGTKSWKALHIRPLNGPDSAFILNKNNSTPYVTIPMFPFIIAILDRRSWSGPLEAWYFTFLDASGQS